MLFLAPPNVDMLDPFLDVPIQAIQMLVSLSTEMEVFLGLLPFVLDCLQVGQFDVIKVAFISVFLLHLLNVILVEVFLFGHQRRRTWAAAAALSTQLLTSRLVQVNDDLEYTTDQVYDGRTRCIRNVLQVLI